MYIPYHPDTPNALCTWCSEWDQEQRWCYSKQRAIQGWNSPRKCSRYQGPELDAENLNKIMEVLR